MKPRVMYIASNYPPRVGGPAAKIPITAEKVSKDFDVSIIAFKEKGTKWFERKKFNLYRSPSCYLFGFSNPLSVFIRTIFITLYSRIIVFKENPKIIHAYDSHISAVAALFCKYTSIRKRKVIVKYAGDLALEFSGLDNGTPLSMEGLMQKMNFKQSILFRFQKTIFNLSDYLHNNDYQTSIANKFYKIPMRKLKEICNPINFDKFKTQKIKHKKFVLLSVARLVPWKGREVLINAMPQIAKEIKNVELVIVGDGDPKFKQTLVDLCKKNKVSDKVKFVGRVKSEDTPKYYRASDVFVHAPTYEPFSNAVLESLVSGIPVVLSNVGGSQKLIKKGKTGYIFESGNVNDFAKKVILAKKNLSVLSKETKANRVNLKCYELDNIISELKNFYFKLIE
ncbi:MAG: glycosyltransferase family 4 protein [Candidatus Diapherotrites archaeon]|nr:glycosyltransferase family 4 protein [Candidatus Diapherotrites archaeon]